MWPNDNVAQDGVKTSFRWNCLGCHCQRERTLYNVWHSDYYSIFMNPSSVESKANRLWVISRHPKCRQMWLVGPHLGNWFIWVNCLVYVCVCVGLFFYCYLKHFPHALFASRSFWIMHMLFTSVPLKRTRKMNEQSTFKTRKHILFLLSYICSVTSNRRSASDISAVLARIDETAPDRVVQEFTPLCKFTAAILMHNTFD